MKVYALNTSDSEGGAAKAAWRIHHAVRTAGVDSTLWVDRAKAGDWTVQSPGGQTAVMAQWVWSRLASRIAALQVSATHGMRSLALRGSSWPDRVNASDADVVHVHWTLEEMMSIADLGRIRKPVVWTLHDMWAFCGAEHYTTATRWRSGYSKTDRDPHDRGLDIDRWAWRRKQRAWRRPMHIVTPSRWLGDCVRSSALMRDWPVTVIPNAIDVNAWSSIDKFQARSLLGLPQDARLVGFGAMAGGRDPRKGIDLLLSALQRLQDLPGLNLVVFGEPPPRQPPPLALPIHYIGHLHDDYSIKAFYSAIDVMVISSRQDNLPNTALEALSCGVPIAAFDTCGMPDVVAHQETGWMARAFDVEALAAGIQWLVTTPGRHAEISRNARAAALRFAYASIGSRYRSAYDDALHTEARPEFRLPTVAS